MWNDSKVLDVHAHVSPPMQGTGMVNMMLRGANTVLPDPLSPGVDAAFGLGEDEWQKSVSRHIGIMDARNIDVQVLGVSRGVELDKKTVREILLDNPLGQGNKMTPFVIVRKVSATAL